MPRATLTLALLGALAAPAAAQATKSIDPGMNQAQVVERLGEPTASRTSGNFTYLFYKNGCGKVCGMDDIVLLENDAVVDAVFRAPERAYTGTSSSPRAIPADVAARTRPGARDVPAAAEPEVTQAGKPAEAAPAPEAPKPAPAATPMTPQRPIGAGTLRIPIKTRPRTPGGGDSTKAATNRKNPT